MSIQVLQSLLELDLAGAVASLQDELNPWKLLNKDVKKSKSNTAKVMSNHFKTIPVHLERNYQNKKIYKVRQQKTMEFKQLQETMTELQSKNRK